ncbi:hypothetical protein ACFE04_019932 [Oxalis oulophora]
MAPSKSLIARAASLVFKVRRREPELICPTRLTPSYPHPLSDIDDQESLRFQIPLIHFYKHNPSMKGKDPVNVIRNALAETLVYYYPFAGRLREGPNRKLSVDCTAEGVLFTEADADVSLKDFRDALQPPFPCLDELLYDVPGSEGVLNCPLLLIQVTRLNCGGFIFGLRLNHTMSDGQGLTQFLYALSEMAQGAFSPSIKPVWERHILAARDPPQVSCVHHEFDDDVADDDCILTTPDGITQRSFFFGSTEISTLRKHVTLDVQRSTTFELITACLWRCRTKALQYDPKQIVRMSFIINCRNKYKPTKWLPSGYYGNAFAYPATLSTVADLTENSLSYSVELIKKVKMNFNEEYIRSAVDLLVTRGRPHFTVTRTFLVSDLTRAGLDLIDFGWGKAVYGGVARAGIGEIPLVSFYVPSKNHNGEDGILVPVCLPGPAMDRFVIELDTMLNKN